jgi:hypothetical protein
MEEALRSTDVLTEILSRLDAKTLFRICAAVCRDWYRLVNADTFWSTKCRIDGLLDSGSFEIPSGFESFLGYFRRFGT